MAVIREHAATDCDSTTSSRVAEGERGAKHIGQTEAGTERCLSNQRQGWSFQLWNSPGKAGQAPSSVAGNTPG